MDGALYLQSQFLDDGRPHWENVRSVFEFTQASNGQDLDDLQLNELSQASDFEVPSGVAKVFYHQHRIAVFYFLITGSKMRVTRWDRSGTRVSTELFDYVECPELLRDVLWGVSQLSREQQGFDSTAVPLVEEDVDFKKMDEVALPRATDILDVEGALVDHAPHGPYTFTFTRDAWRTSIEDTSYRHRLSIPTADGERWFLTGKPLFIHPMISCRTTRGYLAWDVSAEHFVFLKDAWRPPYQSVSAEGNVLRELRAAGVKNIPTWVCDSEIDHENLNSKLRANNGTRGTKRKKSEANHDLHFRHYRIVVEEICFPLCDFKTGRQLISIIRDCVEGMHYC